MLISDFSTIKNLGLETVFFFTKCKAFGAILMYLLAFLGLRLRAKIVYISSESEHLQLSLFQFNASCGMQLDDQNEWNKSANRLPWKAWETSNTSLFPRIKGNVTKPCRMVLGSLIIQQRMGFSDRELVKHIQENP